MEQIPGKPGDAVLVTSDLSKLPESLRNLFEPAVPIPADVRFFEERQTVVESLKALFIGIGLAVVGIALIFPGLLASFYLAIVGAVFVLAGYLMVNSFFSRMKALKDQQAGRQTRYGVFLTDKNLFIRSDLSYTIIPRPSYHDLQGSTLYYRVDQETKSVNLPQTLPTPSGTWLLASVKAWAKGQ